MSVQLTAPASPVTVKVTQRFHGEMAPWLEDNASGGRIFPEQWGGTGTKSPWVKLELPAIRALDLLDFAETWAEEWGAGGSADGGGDAMYKGRMANIYKSAAKSLRTQLAKAGLVD